MAPDDKTIADWQRMIDDNCKERESTISSSRIAFLYNNPNATEEAFLESTLFKRVVQTFSFDENKLKEALENCRNKKPKVHRKPVRKNTPTKGQRKKTSNAYKPPKNLEALAKTPGTDQAVKEGVKNTPVVLKKKEGAVEGIFVPASKDEDSEFIEKETNKEKGEDAAAPKTDHEVAGSIGLVLENPKEIGEEPRENLAEPTTKDEATGQGDTREVEEEQGLSEVHRKKSSGQGDIRKKKEDSEEALVEDTVMKANSKDSGQDSIEILEESSSDAAPVQDLGNNADNESSGQQTISDMNKNTVEDFKVEDSGTKSVNETSGQDGLGEKEDKTIAEVQVQGPCTTMLTNESTGRREVNVHEEKKYGETLDITETNLGNNISGRDDVDANKEEEGEEDQLGITKAKEKNKSLGQQVSISQETETQTEKTGSEFDETETKTSGVEDTGTNASSEDIKEGGFEKDGMHTKAEEKDSPTMPVERIEGAILATNSEISEVVEEKNPGDFTSEMKPAGKPEMSADTRAQQEPNDTTEAETEDKEDNMSGQKRKIEVAVPMPASTSEETQDIPRSEKKQKIFTSTNNTGNKKEMYRGHPDKAPGKKKTVDDGWPEGWEQSIMERQGGSSKGSKDSYFYSPGGKRKFTSLVKVQKYLKALRTEGVIEDEAWESTKR